MTDCICWPTPPEMRTTHYGAVEPGSAMEPNPDCPVHFPRPFRRFGEYVPSACDAWNADEPLEDPVLDANHVRSLDALAQKRHALVPQFDGERLSTPSSTERTYDESKPAGRRTAHE